MVGRCLRLDIPLKRALHPGLPEQTQICAYVLVHIHWFY